MTSLLALPVLALFSSAPYEAPTPGATASPLERVAAIDLPDGATRFDYQSIDAGAGRLYLSHMGAGKVVVVDLAKTKILADLDGYPTVTGVLAVPAEGKLFASATGSHEVVVTDLKSQKVLARVPGARFPDGIAWASAEHKIFVSDESGAKELVIDARTNRSLGTIPLGGEAGNTHYDPATNLIWVAVQTKNEMVSIDPKTQKIMGRYPLPGSDHPHGFYIDSPRHLAYVSCEGNDRLLVVDLKTMKVLQSFPVTEGPDVLAFDAGLRRLYVACEGGAVDVFDVVDGGLRPAGRLSAPNAHTVSVDPKTHRVFLALKNVGGKPQLWVLAPPK